MILLAYLFFARIQKNTEWEVWKTQFDEATRVLRVLVLILD